MSLFVFDDHESEMKEGGKRVREKGCANRDCFFRFEFTIDATCSPEICVEFDGADCSRSILVGR